MSLTAVPPGELAAIVTSLEMLAPPLRRPPPDAPAELVRWPMPAPERYRALFHRVGAPWLWFSRLAIDDAALAAIIHDPAVEVFAITRGVAEIGLLELDFRVAGTCELAFLGLVPEATGQGIGRWLVDAALRRAWRPGMARVWVHTCTLDHPAALGLYRAHGFRAFARAIECFADPRRIGLLPRDCAPHVPLL